MENKVNGKVFLTIAWRLEKELDEMRYMLDKGFYFNKWLQSDYDKYGGENFEIEVLEKGYFCDMDLRSYVNYYDVYNPEKGYNRLTETVEEFITRKRMERNEANKKRSKTQNTTGIMNVTKQKDEKYKQGFKWRYRYVDEDGKRKSINSVDLDKLKEKVLAKGLPWEEL